MNKKILIPLFFILLIFFIILTAQANTQPLPAEQAFLLKTEIKSNQLLLQWTIAPGYYLYRDKTTIQPTSANQIKLGPIVLPTGEKKQNKLQNKIKIAIPILSETAGLLQAIITYQGCATAGFCYPPIKKQLIIHYLPNLPASISTQDYTTQLITHHHFIIIIPIFLGLGLLLAFTPCVLPLIPILSGIIAGHSRKHLTTQKAFLLSFCYVMGMSFTYMILGMIVALLGSRVQFMMQNPWVIGLFSVFFVVLAFSLFGWYELQFPPSWQKYLIKWDQRFKSGTYSGVLLMGCFSSLIVSPCVSAPLVGVLAYIGQTGNIILGAVALFMLGIGMGLPLLLIGTSAGRLLPKSGPWMLYIQKIMGCLMLGMAIWLLFRIIPDHSNTLFTVIKTNTQLQQKLDDAKLEKKPVILEFYADWCISCKIIQKNVFEDSTIQPILKNFILLRADITHNTAFDQMLLKKYQVIAPPTFLFFDSNGVLLTSQQWIGDLNKKQFLQHLNNKLIINK